MNEMKKKVIIAGSIAIVALVCIFGGQYAAKQIEASRVEEQTAPVASAEPVKKTPAPVEPIVEATIYDENGSVSITPTPEDKAEAEANAKAAEAVAPKTEAPKVETPKEAPKTTTAPKTETPKTVDKPKSEPKPKEEPKPVAPKEEPKQEQPVTKDEGGHEGQVYDPVFGWTDSTGSESIPMEDQGGDWNKLVGE